MGKALIFVFLLIGLTADFKKAADWFQYKKNINIVPAAFIEMIAVIVFMFTYGSQYTDEIVWMWLSVAIVLAVTVFNLVKYGVRDGALASLAELAFSISAAFLLACILVSRSQKTKRKSTRYRKK